MAETAKLTRDDWVAAGLAALTEDGPARLKADVLARRLKVSRGSFYWHFKDLGDFHQAVLDRWIRAAVEEPYANAAGPGETPADPRAALASLIEDALSAPIRMERAVLAWAVGHKPAAAAVDQVNRRRIALLEGLLRAMGQPEATAQARAALLCSVYLGRMHLPDGALDAAARAEMAALILEP